MSNDLSKDFIDVLLGDSVNATLQLPDPMLVQYYRDLKARSYWITAEIDDDYMDLVSKIIDWNRVDKDIPPDERVPIKLFISSPGGIADVADALCSIIEISETPIHGIALGQVASAASLIYLSCHKRYALKNAVLMLHKGSCNGLSANYNEMKAFMEDYNHQIEEMINFYINHTKYSEEEIRKNINTDWYIRGDELLKQGLVTDWIEDIGILL